MQKVTFIEPVGGRGGMYYYDFALCSALLSMGVSLTLVTSEETKEHRVPSGLDVRYDFRGVYGKKSFLRRGLNYLISLIKIYRAMSEQKGIVHLHIFQVLFLDYLFMHLLKKKGHKIVLTAHDVVPFNAKFYTRLMLRRIYRIPDHIIVHARDNKEELSRTFQIGREKISVIPHGHYLPFLEGKQMDRDEAKRELSLAESSDVVLFFGQIKKTKRLDTLIKALPRVIQDRPDCVLLIAGKTWKDDFARYAKLISWLKLEDHVRSHIGYVPDEKVALYFSAADVVALPYQRIYQSGVLLMAFTFGRPVVASAVGGMPEVVRDGETGYLVPPGDESELARGLLRILSDKEKARDMGERARRLVEEQFSWEMIAEKTKEVYALLDKGAS